MNYGKLDSLRTDDFDLPLTFYSTPSGLRRRLAQTEEIRQIKAALRSGAITEGTVSDFVDELLQSLRKEERFPYETALAGLAVVMEDRFTPFATEFLEKLSALRIAEMALSSGVARLCLAERPAKPVHLDLGSFDGSDSKADPAIATQFGLVVRGDNPSVPQTPTLRRTGTCG